MPSPLELAPPQPSQVGQPGAPPQPSLQGLAGGQAGPGPQGDQSLQIVTQHLMEAEQAIRAAIRIKPELSGVLEGFLNNVKPQIGQILFGGGQQQPPQMGAPGMGSLMASAARPSLSSQP